VKEFMQRNPSLLLCATTGGWAAVLASWIEVNSHPRLQLIAAAMQLIPVIGVSFRQMLNFMPVLNIFEKRIKYYLLV